VSLLSTLVASKPNGDVLELGTGSGLSTSFLLQGMDNQSKLTTIDSENTLVSIR
jgi:predicted O-methyltransferase YrrM